MNNFATLTYSEHKNTFTRSLLVFLICEFLQDAGVTGLLDNFLADLPKVFII